MCNIMLEEFIEIIPGDIKTGLIKGTKTVCDIKFTNIHQLSAQYRKDRVIAFDFCQDSNGERMLIVKLAHWGIRE